MKSPKCYLCGGKKVNLLYSVNQWNIYKCDSCLFIYVYPLLSRDELKALYLKFKANIFEKSNIILNDAKHSLNYFSKHRFGKKTLLDIGCGNGIFMDEAANSGWSVTGIETSLDLFSYLKKTYTYKFIQGDILTTHIKQKFDLVTLNQVIEHFSEPKLLIKRCYELLNNRGLIYIATPNISSIVAKIRKNDFDYVIPPEHLSYFNDKSLIRILTNEGFQVIKVGTWSYPVDLAGLIKFFLGKRRSIVLNKSVNSDRERTFTKNIKYFLFDKIFCRMFYKFLNINNGGTMVEILAQKQ